MYIIREKAIRRGNVSMSDRYRIHVRAAATANDRILGHYAERLRAAIMKLLKRQGAAKLRTIQNVVKELAKSRL